MFQHLFTGVVLGAVIWFLAPLGTAGAETILIDDFNDGNDEGWTHYAPGFLAPGIFVVEDGAYHIRSAVKANEDRKNWLASLWDASDDPRFSNGFVTMKARVNADGVVVGAGMRTDSGTESMYWFSGGSTDDNFVVFDSNDMVQVFQAGKYEIGWVEPSGYIHNQADWAEGDWDANGMFESADMVAAFVDGGYELGPRANVAVVPEPTTWTVLVISLVLWSFDRRNHRAV